MNGMRTLRDLPLGALLALLSMGGLAQAQQTASSTPLAFGVSETVTHDSNLFRAVDGSEQADWLSLTALNLTLDQPLGRQRLRGNASLNLSRYRDNDQLNNAGHDLQLQLDWETAGNLSGGLGVQSTRQQYRYGFDSVQPFDGLNAESTQSAFARARWGGMGEWGLMAGMNTLRRDYSAASFAANELSQWSADVGGSYRPGPDLMFSLVTRHTEIARPDVGALIGDDLGRDDLELGAQWQASGASRFELSVARSNEAHDLSADRQFWTGSLTWNWAPSAKLKFSTRVLRDTAGSSGVSADPAAVAAGSQLRDAALWSAVWEVSAKVSVDAGVQWSKRRLSGVVGGNALTAEDRTLGLNLGARYSPTRSLDLSCSVLNERREVDAASLLLTRPYDDLAVRCALQFWIR
ncbi:MAG: hypothetical protein IV094_19485 [Vitreoscilla sp.]|nr:hypothetical protein [Vitreoscilla sp.]